MNAMTNLIRIIMKGMVVAAAVTAVVLAVGMTAPAYAGSCADGLSCNFDLSNLNINLAGADIHVQVTIDNTNPDNNTRLIVTMISENLTNTPLGIDQFGYNDSTTTILTYPTATTGGWSSKTPLNKDGTAKGVQIDGFGTFTTDASESAGTGGVPGSAVDPLIFVLNDLVTNFPDNANGAEFVVHLRFDAPADGSCSTFVSDGTSSQTGAVGQCAVVPEPATLFLLGSGLLGLGFAGRKRFRGIKH